MDENVLEDKDEYSFLKTRFNGGERKQHIFVLFCSL